VLHCATGAVDVDIPDIGEILVLFSKTMDGSSINSDSVRVADAGGSRCAAPSGMGGPSVGDEAAIFTPEQPLVRSTQYHVAVTTAVRDSFVSRWPPSST